MSACVFCRIVAGELPAHVVHEDAHVMAILDIGHVNPGHTLVLAKAHVETLLEADEGLSAHMFRIANRIAKGLQQAFPSEGLTILQANRPAGFQTVPHLHLHILPRFKDDGVGLVWPAKTPPQDILADYAARLRPILASRTEGDG